MNNNTETKKERRARMYNLAREVSKLTPEQRNELSSKCMVTTIEGRSLSVTNQCLIAMQIPSATIVGGFRQWLRAGRVVMKGQHGACIWVPCGYKQQATDGETDIVERTGFILGTVFDVSQTQEKTEQGSEEQSTNERANVLEMAA